MDEHEVKFCTHLQGKASQFLPFNRGDKDGAGNPTNPDGLKADYLWRQVLTRDSLTDILENYAQFLATKDENSSRKTKRQIWPRYHQLDIVRKLLAAARCHGAGQRYLIQHSAGSGKSNSIAWLAHQLIGLAKEGKPVFDSVIVVTDRRILDQQIRDTIKQFAQVGATVGHAERSGDLRQFIESGKKIVISTVQKFPFIRYLQGEQRDRLDPILDTCVEAYREELDESGQVDFKGKAKTFIPTYGFLSMVLPYANAEWEKRTIFLNLLVPKLPAPREEDMSRGILEAIDMDSYRVEKQLTMSIQLPDDDGEIEPVPVAGGGGKSDPELDRLSNIVKAFNERFGNILWEDADRVHRLITEDIPACVGADEKYRNARENSDRQNARIELDKAVSCVMNSMINDDTQLFRKFADDEGFKRWLTDTVFDLTYK